LIGMTMQRFAQFRRALRVLSVLTLALPAATLAQTASASPGFTTEQIEAGRLQFERTCAQCHGRNMVNAGITVYDLRKFPVDDPNRFQHSVTQGKGNMPSFKEALTAEQVGLLWAYVGTRGGKER
jgi:cytochrome c6